MTIPVTDSKHAENIEIFILVVAPILRVSRYASLNLDTQLFGDSAANVLPPRGLAYSGIFRAVGQLALLAR